MSASMKDSPNGIAQRPRQSVLALSGLALAALITTACGYHRPPDQQFVAMSDPRKAHPITVVADTARLDLPLGPNGEVAAQSWFDIARFARHYRQEGKGALSIAVPPDGRRGGAVADSVRAVRTVIAQAGVSPARVRWYSSHRDTIALSYDRIAAVPPTCGDWSESVVRNPENLPMPNWGCASQRNLALMVANPTDLVYPAAETTGRLSERRAAAYKEYKDPQKTDVSVKTKTQQ